MSTIPFLAFNQAVQKQFALMVASGAPLVALDIDKETLWNTYLDSFPAGTNNIFRQRREYDCNCCKNFIRRLGHVVALTPNGYMTIWDTVAPGYYGEVAKAMHAFVSTHPVLDTFVTSERVAGSLPTREESITWNHFYVAIPSAFVKSSVGIGTYLSHFRGSFQVFERTMKELTLDAFDSVLELIAQNSLYRGSEFKEVVNVFRDLKQKYDGLSQVAKTAFLYKTVNQLQEGSRFRNTAIGTLVTDLSDGVSLDKAVTLFESKVAPQNYKRTSSLVTSKMITQAQETLETLGLSDNLYRRFATEADIQISNVIFASEQKKALNVFDDLTNEANSVVAAKTLKKVEEIHIDKFLADVLPTAKSVEALVEGRHIPNFMSILTASNPITTNMFKWDNPFTWTYTGDITDAIKEKVKAAGGNVEGYLRVSLAWFNSDDLDLSLVEPKGYTLYFGNRSSAQGGRLDIDANGGHVTSSTEPVENIFYKDKHQVIDGDYKVIVDQFNTRKREDKGFTLQIEFNGVVTNYNYNLPFDARKKHMLTLHVKDGLLSITNHDTNLIPSHTSGKEFWNISTNSFVPVTRIMSSPNHWDGQAIGNKHTFFILENCLTPDMTRGFFNEYLRGDLTEHRKVFEILGSKTKAEPTAAQLSGIGFSETVRNDLVVRVTGKTVRTLKITF